jgi:uncharacterized protein DUF6538
MAFFFVPDRKSFYYRSHIPKRLRRLIRGRHEIWRSLDTTDRDEARLRAARWDSRTLQLYRRLKRVGERMTEEQREALVTKWLNSQLEEAEDWRVTNGPYPEDQGEGASMILTDQVDDALEQLATYDFSKIEKEATQAFSPTVYHHHRHRLHHHRRRPLLQVSGVGGSLLLDSQPYSLRSIFGADGVGEGSALRARCGMVSNGYGMTRWWTPCGPAEGADLNVPVSIFLSHVADKRDGTLDRPIQVLARHELLYKTRIGPILPSYLA